MSALWNEQLGLFTHLKWKIFLEIFSHNFILFVVHCVSFSLCFRHQKELKKIRTGVNKSEQSELLKLENTQTCENFNSFWKSSEVGSLNTLLEIKELLTCGSWTFTDIPVIIWQFQLDSGSYFKDIFRAKVCWFGERFILDFFSWRYWSMNL